MKIIFNNQICKLAIYKKVKTNKYYLSSDMTFDKFKYFFIPTFKKRKGVFSFGEFNCSETDFPMTHSKYYFEDEKCYLKPHCDIYLSNGYNETKFFSSNLELDDFIGDLKNQNPNITFI